MMKSNYSISSYYVYFTAFVVLCCFCVFVDFTISSAFKTSAQLRNYDRKEEEQQQQEQQHNNNIKMARLFLDQEPLTQYKDRRFEGNLEEY